MGFRLCPVRCISIMFTLDEEGNPVRKQTRAEGKGTSALSAESKEPHSELKKES